MTDPSACLVALAFAEEDPVQRPEAVVGLARRLFADLEVEPARWWWVTVAGQPRRERAVNWDDVAQALREPRMGTLALDGVERRPGAELYVHLDVRRDPELGRRAPPSPLAFVCRPDAELTLARAAQAACGFLRGAASSFAILHGGATLVPNRSEALTEITLAILDYDRQPAGSLERWRHDSRSARRLWDVARRVYWATLLGPRLAGAAGGDQAALAAGAASVETVDGSLLVLASDDPFDVYGPDGRARTASLRRWLWPHTTQNPVDAP